MTNINAFAFTLPVKIFQLWVNIILGGVYKMESWFVVSVCSLVCSVSVLSYMLGYRMGRRFESVRMWNQTKYIFRDSAKIAAEHLRMIGKT